MLRARARELTPVKFATKCKAELLRQGDERVEVEIQRGERRSRIEARYTVGRDGSHSITRLAAGISETASARERLMRLPAFRSENRHKLLEKRPGRSFFNALNPSLDGYRKYLGELDAFSEWFLHAPGSVPTTADKIDVPAILYEAVGAEFKFDLTHIGFWHLFAAMADRYRSGNIFLARAFVPSHPPYEAYGIDTGFDDARSLGWKLAAVLKGLATNLFLILTMSSDIRFSLQRRQTSSKTILHRIARFCAISTLDETGRLSNSNRVEVVRANMAKLSIRAQIFGFFDCLRTSRR